MEQSRDRKEDLAELEDPRVDLCIFCIPPHRWGGTGAGRELLLWVNSSCCGKYGSSWSLQGPGSGPVDVRAERSIHGCMYSPATYETNDGFNGRAGAEAYRLQQGYVW